METQQSIAAWAPEEVVAQVNAVMIEGFSLKSDQLIPTAHLYEDLKLDSLDAIDMMVHIEDRFKVKLDGDKLMEVRTLADIYKLANDVITKKSSDASPSTH